MGGLPNLSYLLAVSEQNVASSLVVRHRFATAPISLNWVTARVRIAFEISFLALLALSAAVACGGSSGELAQANGLITFSKDGEIYVTRADGSAQRRLTRSRAKNIAPAGSPDGRKIAFASDREFEVYVMNADGSGQVRLTRKPANAFPAWSPDGRRMAFVSDRDSNLEIYIMNADGGRPTGGVSPADASATATSTST